MVCADKILPATARPLLQPGDVVRWVKLGGLALRPVFRQIVFTMTAKAQILEEVAKMPDEASMDEIVEQVKLIAGIRQARKDVKQGRVVPIEEVEKELPKGISKS